MSTQSVSSRDNVFVRNVFVRWDRIPSFAQRVVEIIQTWRRRSRSRGELAALTAFDLKDIGYPAQAEAEKYKPFWQR